MSRRPVSFGNRRPVSFGLITVLIVAGMATSFARSRWPFHTPNAADSRLDLIFARWTDSTPGCAVAAAVDGRVMVSKGYGMADLEHGVKITPDTIFEAGSVSKQFTAAAVLVLAHEGKLALDDPARKYVPELPDYHVPLTIRHLLTHTSGLRDWGSVEAIAGWPRGTRTYTHAHVLEIVSRQHALNFTPGTRWSYSNTGYNLAALIVSRVSGMPFAEFTRRFLFEPNGMSDTSWRDDYTRIVKRRAIAYAERDREFHTDMPFENVYGNAGLLTTVGDLLKWNEHFTTPTNGDADIVAMQQRPGAFNDGRRHGYAFGLMVGSIDGMRVVEHGGSTAGYRAHLLRYPDLRVSVAVLCNVTTADAAARAHDVADLYLDHSLKAPAPSAAYTLTPADIDRIAGLYRNISTGTALAIGYDKTTSSLLVDGRRTRLVARSGTDFVSPDGQSWQFEPDSYARATDRFATTDAFEKVALAHPTADDLRQLAGTYISGDAESTLTAVVDGSSLVLKRRPDTTIRLAPVYADAFTAPQLGLVIFRRDPGGRVSTLSVVQDRVWNLPFTRESPAETR